MCKKTLYAAISLLSLFFVGCKNYSLSVNDNTLYTPAKIFKSYQIVDTALADCVAQTIIDLHVTKAEDLKQLNCSKAGIKTLTGLNKFFALTELNLNDNKIQDINELSNLGRLEILHLQNNNITHSAPLLNLLHLHQLNLSHNPIKDCNSLQQLRNNLTDNKVNIILDNVCVK